MNLSNGIYAAFICSFLLIGCAKEDDCSDHEVCIYNGQSQKLELKVLNPDASAAVTLEEGDSHCFSTLQEQTRIEYSFDGGEVLTKTIQLEYCFTDYTIEK